MTNFICFSFALAYDQKSLNAACNHIFLTFWAVIMNFLITLKCLVFFLLIVLQEEVLPFKYHLYWICTSNKNKALKTIKFSFSAILWNLLWSKFWNHFQAEIIQWIFFEILNFIFSNIIPKGDSSCKILPFPDSRISTSRNTKLKNSYKFTLNPQFRSFLVWPR